LIHFYKRILTTNTMSSVDGKKVEKGAVAEHGGTCFVRQDDCIGESDGAASDDHNYTKNNQSKKEDVIISASEMKHRDDIFQEVTKVLKSEETVPEWELDLSDSNDSKENLHKMVIKSDTPVTYVNSNEATSSVTKHKFNLSNILPIPTNISVQRLFTSPPAQYGEQVSNTSPSSNCKENISMVPPCSLSKKEKSSESKAVHQAAGNIARGSQAHPLKEQLVVKKSRITKTDSQAVSEKLVPIPSLPGFIFAGQQSEPEPEEGPPSKKLKQSPYFQQPAPPGQYQITRPDLAQPSPASPAQYQVIRPAQAQPRPALVRQVRPGQPRAEVARRGGMWRGSSRWPPPSQMLAHSRSLPTSVSPRHPLRFPPQRYSQAGPAQIPPPRRFQRHPFHPTHPLQISSQDYQMIPKAPPGMNPPEPTQSQQFSQYQYDQATPPPNRVSSNSFVSLPSHHQVRKLSPSLSVSRVSSSSMPVFPLPTLATALAGLGMQEGRKKVVQLSLTLGQIEALSMLGIKEENVKLEK